MSCFQRKGGESKKTNLKEQKTTQCVVCNQMATEIQVRKQEENNNSRHGQEGQDTTKSKIAAVQSKDQQRNGTNEERKERKEEGLR